MGNDVAVWYRRTEHLDPSSLAAIDDILSDEERERRDSFVFPADRRDFAAAHALLRNALSRYGLHAPAEWNFEKDRHGKPAIGPSQAGSPPLVFNLSHTRGLVACVIARGTNVGIDVERSTRLADTREVASLFSQSELEHLAKCEADTYDARFIELWTLKEAYMKAVGLGLGIPLDSFGFEFKGQSCLRLASGDRQDGWQFWLAAMGHETRLAMAVARQPGQSAWRIAFHSGDVDADSDVSVLRWSESPDCGAEG